MSVMHNNDQNELMRRKNGVSILKIMDKPWGRDERFFEVFDLLMIANRSWGCKERVWIKRKD